MFVKVFQGFNLQRMKEFKIHFVYIDPHYHDFSEIKKCFKLSRDFCC